MRKFRNAALAAATAVTVAFAGVSVAGAETEQTPTDKPAQSQVAAGSTAGSSKDREVVNGLSSIGVKDGITGIGAATEADKLVNATNLFGSSVNDEENPLWSLLWRDGATIAAIAAALGGVIAAYNYAVYQGIIPHAIQF